MHPELAPIVYARYGDDIFVLIKDKSELEIMRNLFEAYTVLRFTTECDRDEQLSFLDVIMRKDGNRILTSVYTKPKIGLNDAVASIGCTPEIR